MAVYVDDVRIAWREDVWCHLVADSLEELHTFASVLGLKREWFQKHASYPHYDVTVRSRDKALALGAKFGSRAEIIGCAKALKLELERNTPEKISMQLSLFDQ